MIGSHGNVRGAAANHSQNGSEHASHRGDLAAVPIPCGRQGVVVAEQLVCAVDQVDFQDAAPALTLPDRMPLHQPRETGCVHGGSFVSDRVTLAALG